MNRRLWPAALAAASVVLLGTYLFYTTYLMRQIRREAAIHAQIYSLVQRGLLAPPGQGEELSALMDMQDQLQALDVPIVIFNTAGEPYLVNNLPFEVDLSTAEGKRRALDYAARLAGARPGNMLTVPGVGSIYFGDPPILRWLRWIPWLQVGAGVLLIWVAFVVLRADMRAHRERLWSAMARELAHQMGTPLSSLAGWIEVLELAPEERAAMPPPEHVARVMQADVERLERVSRRFELIGKPQPLQPARVPDLIDELVCYFRPRLPHLGRGIRLRARVADDLPPIRANPVLLVWALENIVKNAVDALAGRGGRITILAAADDRSVHLSIADDGPGIAPSIRDRIFDPGVTTKSAGWGVGLSLSRRIVEELHHGRITVQNRTRRGTIFTVALPIADR
jgi:signal transduction histidine kinase